MRYWTLILCLGCALTGAAQVTGGRSSFAFLEASNSGKVAALGGDNVSSFGDDISMLYQNPALMNEEMYNKVSVNVTRYLPGVQLSTAQYTFADSKIGAFSAGINYINYGRITRRDEGGTNQGSFYSNEFVLYGTKSFEQDNFKIGFTPKLAYSQIERFSALAFLTDIGGTFNHPTKDVTIGLAVKNIGVVAKDYTDTKSDLPFNVVAGFSVKPKHMPLKMSITAHHLQQFDIVYDDPAQRSQNLFGDSVEYKVPLGALVLRHFTVGGEFILAENFNLRIGYGFQRRRELRLSDRSGGAGFSFGFMVKKKAYQIDVTKVYNNYAGRPIYLTVHIDIDALVKKKEAPIEDI